MSLPPILPAAVYALAAPLERLRADLRLRSLEWGVLFAVTGRHTVAQIGASLELPGEERDQIFRRLAELGLIDERPLTAREYLRAAATVGGVGGVGGEPRTLAGFLAGGLAGPDAEPVVVPILEAQEIQVEENGFEPLALPEEEIVMNTTATLATPPPPMSLRAVMRFITAQAPASDAGQLDVYRAFVRVSPQLLKRSGITTLRFEDDRLVSDPDLQQAILASVRHVVGKPCPPDVFVG